MERFQRRSEARSYTIVAFYKGHQTNVTLTQAYVELLLSSDGRIQERNLMSCVLRIAQYSPHRASQSTCVNYRYMI